MNPSTMSVGLGPTGGRTGPKTSPFTDLEGAMECAADLMKRVSVLADRLVGPFPEEPTGVVSNAEFGGAIGDVERNVLRLHSIVSHVNNALTRIERALP